MTNIDINVTLNENERINRVNDDIALIEHKDGLTFGTDALLLAGYIEKNGKRALEIGGGTGIISLLTLKRNKFDSVDCCEIQETFCDIIKRNAALAALEDRLTVLNLDIRDYKSNKQYDTLFTNPPYMLVSGRRNENDKKNIARHELNGGICDFLLAAKRLLKFGGRFYAVYRPDRLADLLFAMKSASIEPKRITFVYADCLSEPSMVLTEGRMGGKSGMKVTRPLIIYKDKEHTQESADMEYILKNGSFPDDFTLGNRGRKNGRA